MENQQLKEQNGDRGSTLLGWKDLPMELLLRIISVVGDDWMVIVTSSVCTGWHDALGWGVMGLSFSWSHEPRGRRRWRLWPDHGTPPSHSSCIFPRCCAGQSSNLSEICRIRRW